LIRRSRATGTDCLAVNPDILLLPRKEVVLDKLECKWQGAPLCGVSKNPFSTHVRGKEDKKVIREKMMIIRCTA
jgi:hypothetical protein